MGEIEPGDPQVRRTVHHIIPNKQVEDALKSLNDFTSNEIGHRYYTYTDKQKMEILEYHLNQPSVKLIVTDILNQNDPSLDHG